jgi:putative FmdB family regulatory protein
MPTYEYVCTECQNAWEEIQKISEPPLTDCPKCGKASAKRQISGGNFILKGGGWYADLYSSSPKKSDSSGGGETKSSTSSSSTETKKESAPAPAKTESSAPKATS